MSQNIHEQLNTLFKSIEIDDLVKNLQLMGNTIHLDMVPISPALHEKKKLETALAQAIKDNIGGQYELKIKYLEAPAKPVSIGAMGQSIPGVKYVLAVASGKGGVGKSTIASNLAVALQLQGFSVGLLDADIYGPSAPIMFDVQEYKPQSIQMDGQSKMLPAESYGVKIMSLGFFAGTGQAVVWRGAMATKAIRQLVRDTHWGDLDFLIIDLPPGTGDIHLSMVQELPITGSVVVCTPQKIALADARKGVAMFQLESINVPVLGIVENMAYFTPAELPDNQYYIFGQGGAKELADEINVPFLAEIPIVQSIREAGDAGRPAALQNNTPVSNAFDALAKNVVQSLVDRNEQLPPTEAVRITTMAGCSTKN